MSCVQVYRQEKVCDVASLSAHLCSKLDVLLEWKQVSVSQTHTTTGEPDAVTTATKFKMDSKFGQSFYQRFSNLLGTMA